MIAGIDPGMTGAIAFLYDDPRERRLFVEDMPTLGKEINAVAVADLLREFPPDHVYLEAVNSFGMGRQSAFNFGQGVGVIKGVLAALVVPYTPVSPAKWKKHFSLGRDKDKARAIATHLYPQCGAQFTRKKDHGRAEAALLAHWAKEIKSCATRVPVIQS